MWEEIKDVNKPDAEVRCEERQRTGEEWKTMERNGRVTIRSLET